MLFVDKSTTKHYTTTDALLVFSLSLLLLLLRYSLELQWDTARSDEEGGTFFEHHSPWPASLTLSASWCSLSLSLSLFEISEPN